MHLVRGLRQTSEPTPTGINLAIGCVVMVAAAFLAAALFPPDAIPARLVVLAVVVGVFAAVVPDIRAALGVAGLSVLVFTGFLANHYGELTTRDGDVWWYALLIGSAATIGTGLRWIRARRFMLTRPQLPRQRTGSDVRT